MPAAVAEPVMQYMSPEELQIQIDNIARQMQEAARRTDFMEAAALRDIMYDLKERLEKNKN